VHPYCKVLPNTIMLVSENIGKCFFVPFVSLKKVKKNEQILGS